MGLVPDTRNGKLEFFQSKIAPWSAHATDIGTTTVLVDALDAKIAAAVAGRAAQVAAAAAARTATATYYSLVEQVAVAGADIIRQIRTKAEMSPNPNTVYDLAQIPAPALPTPVGPPGTPTELKVTLNPDGSLALSWKCANPANGGGPIYHVYRGIGNPDDMTFIGGSGERKFLDATVPAGSAIVYYKIQAIRTTAVGPAGEFMVRFGVAGSGAAGAITVTAIENTSPKMAA